MYRYNHIYIYIVDGTGSVIPSSPRQFSEIRFYPHSHPHPRTLFPSPPQTCGSPQIILSSLITYSMPLDPSVTKVVFPLRLHLSSM